VAGKYQETEAASVCNDCARGKFSEVAAMVCVDCVAGKYANGTGKASDCDDCETGKYSNKVGATTCLYCGSGKYLEPGIEIAEIVPCFPCPVGFSCAGGGQDIVMCPTALSTGWSYCPEDPQLQISREELQISREELQTLRKMNKVLSKIANSTSAMQKCAAEGSDWNYTSSVTWAPRSSDVPAWNQLQHKHCQPIFTSWPELRQQIKGGGLQAKIGGLGQLLIPGEYEVWICVFDDACALGGDWYFCYVHEETTEKFVPWDQHFNLRLFQPRKVP